MSLRKHINEINQTAVHVKNMNFAYDVRNITRSSATEIKNESAGIKKKHVAK